MNLLCSPNLGIANFLTACMYTDSIYTLTPNFFASTDFHLTKLTTNHRTVTEVNVLPNFNFKLLLIEGL